MNKVNIILALLLAFFCVVSYSKSIHFRRLQCRIDCLEEQEACLFSKKCQSKLGCLQCIHEATTCYSNCHRNPSPGAKLSSASQTSNGNVKVVLSLSKEK